MAPGARSSDGDDPLIADINVTPLVDITLVLLIIFMVAAPIIANTPSIKVNLPRAATGDETPKPTLALTVQRRPEGGYVLYANGEPTDEDHVRALVPELVRRDPGLLATVAADRGIEYGDVVHVVDVVKALGVHRFALDIEAR
ncbi:MAG TPA: biopolymer transporter ExbD [Haliangiales bacterium]|nr:biopolymer transporter ExbD [Haliangiales bacterium]